MSELIQRVEAELLAPKGIESADVQNAIEHMLGRNVDYGEVFIQALAPSPSVLKTALSKMGLFRLTQESGCGR